MQSEIYWIDGPWRGKLAIVPRPRGGDWMEGEIEAWQKAGLDTIVSLLEPEESAHFGLQREESCALAKGLRFHHFPIPDRSIPGNPESLDRFLSVLSQSLDESRNVGIHCRQSVGRSGLLAVALLASSGDSLEHAIQQVSAARGVPVPETAGQLDWLENHFGVATARPHRSH